MAAADSSHCGDLTQPGHGPEAAHGSLNFRNRTPDTGEQMAKDFLGDRKQALEESFFAKENAKLLDKLKAQKDKKAAKDQTPTYTSYSRP